MSTSWNRRRLGGLAPALREIGAMGLRACEIDVPHAELEVRAASAYVAQSRMSVVSVRWPDEAGVAFHELVDPDPARRAAAERLVEVVIASAASLRASVLVIPAFDVLGASSRWPDVERALDPDVRAEAVTRDVEARRGLVEEMMERQCRAAHAVQGLEPALKLAFAPSPSPGSVPGSGEIEWLLDDRPSAAVFAWHDTGVTAVREGFGVDPPGSWLERGRRKLAGAYLADASGVAFDLPPGAGTIDWDSVREGLPGDVPRLLKVAPPFARLAVQEGIESVR